VNVRFRHRAAALVAAALFVTWTSGAGSYETDPFYQRQQPLRDARPVLNREVNKALEDIVARWKGPRDERRMIDAIFHRLGGYYWVDHLEDWAWRSPEVQRIDTPHESSIYYGPPIWVTRVSYLFHLGPTLKVAGQRIGTDKIGHFFSQGRKFNRRWRRSRSETQAARWSEITEAGIFGQMTTGDFSNADLVANYQGHRFYRSLFEDDIVPGRKALLRWDSDHWTIQRPFDWADYVDPYWDEAVDVDHFDRLLRPYMVKAFEARCADYLAAPAIYDIPDAEDQRLWARYAFLGLRDSRDLRLSSLCRSSSRSEAGEASP